MKVKLFGHTTPVDDLDIEGLDDVQDLIAYCAKVSNPQFQNNFETSERLLTYLADHAHWSPFEMASVTIGIERTRDIARPKNRQDSVELNMDRPFDRDLDREWRLMQEKSIAVAKEAYDWALSKGIAKEVARAVLPEGNTVSRLYMQGTVRSWIHYIQLRSGNGTQKEHMEIALEVAKAIHKIFPLSEQFISN